MSQSSNNSKPVKAAKAAPNPPPSTKQRLRRGVRKAWAKQPVKLAVGVLGMLLLIGSFEYFTKTRNQEQQKNVASTSATMEVKPDVQSQNALAGPAGTPVSAQTFVSTTTQGVKLMQNQLNCQKFKTGPAIMVKLKARVWKKAYDSEAVAFNLSESQRTGQYISTGKTTSPDVSVNALDLEEAWCVLGENKAQYLQMFIANMNAAQATSDKVKLANLWQTNSFIREGIKYN